MCCPGFSVPVCVYKHVAGSLEGYFKGREVYGFLSCVAWQFWKWAALLAAPRFTRLLRAVKMDRENFRLEQTERLPLN